MVDDPEQKPQYKIEKGIPMPPKQGHTRYPGLYRHLGEMDVGDSVFVAGGTFRGIGGLVSARIGRKFSQRQVTENGVKGIRIFRID